MTNTVMSSRSPSPCCDAWNACAVPANRPSMVARQRLRARARSPWSIAAPSETPGARLNEIVTDGHLAGVGDAQRAEDVLEIARRR